ncbi:hypothetical protein GA0115239_106632 [Streptomyces sp. BpilaLS-43]|nr:hypothetical protein GA0115239_106632 [Streptomyces sp. BpilaLS-43]
MGRPAHRGDAPAGTSQAPGGVPEATRAESTGSPPGAPGSSRRRNARLRRGRRLAEFRRSFGSVGGAPNLAGSHLVRTGPGRARRGWYGATAGARGPVTREAAEPRSGLCQGRMRIRCAPPVPPPRRRCRGSMSRSGVPVVLARRFVHSLWRRRCVGWWGGAVSPRASAPWARSAARGRGARSSRSAPNSCGATRIRCGPSATGAPTRCGSSRPRPRRAHPPSVSRYWAAAGPPTNNCGSASSPPGAGPCAISPPGRAATRPSSRSAAASPSPVTSPGPGPSSTRPGPTAPRTPRRPSRWPT